MYAISDAMLGNPGTKESNERRVGGEQDGGLRTRGMAMPRRTRVDFFHGIRFNLQLRRH